MQVEWAPIASVIPYARNPRRNEAAVAKVAASLREYGWRQPIVVDDTLTVIAGHTRLAAARSLGMTTVPVHVARGLTKAQVRAYRIADNRTGQEAEWDNDLLALEFADLAGEGFDLSLTGFDPDELTALMAPASGILDGADLDDAPPLPAEPITKPGDLIILGRHRVLSGDSTKAEDVARLMVGSVAECLWTDPPYGVSYVGKTKDALTIENDGAEGLEALLGGAFAAADSALAPGGRVYCAAPAGPRNLAFRVAFVAAGWRLHQELVWVKSSMVLGHADYHYRHEPILYGYKPGEGRVGRGDHPGTRWYGDHSQTSVFEIDKPSRSKEHPTMKPVELVRRCLENSSKAGDVILDTFGGSGTTLLAAEVLGRTACLMELDPRYCDVIVMRWETATGEKAERST